MIITRAAIMYANGEVVDGRDYGYISSIAHKLSLPSERIEGFLTSSGEFVLPSDAAAIAVEARQITEAPSMLTPEDLWPHLTPQ